MPYLIGIAIWLSLQLPLGIAVGKFLAYRGKES